MQIILNADDFGRSSSINSAVKQAFQNGLLTSASLMVTGEAFYEAVVMARQMPDLAVGLHIVLIQGRPVLPPGDIPAIVEDDGTFMRNPARVWLNFLFNATARQQAVREMQAQFDRYAETGLPLTHVDGHLHLHMHPSIFRPLLPLAVQYRAKGLRLPRDNAWFSLKFDHQRIFEKTLWAIVFRILNRSSYQRIQTQSLKVTQQVYGLMESGHMSEDYLLKLLGEIDIPSAELYFHPDTAHQMEPLGPNPGDLAALLSPAVRRLIEERGIQRVNYATLNDHRGNGHVS
jgi:hopanoid biosynthesis associated protein HpnK